MLWPDCCQIMTFVTRLLSKLWISWPDYCQNNKYCDQIGVKKLEALHLMCLRCAPRLLWEDNQCNMILQLLQQIPIILVRNDFAASPATNPNNFLVTDKHFHNVRHLYDKNTNKHKRSNKSTPIFSFILQVSIVWFKPFKTHV